MIYVTLYYVIVNRASLSLESVECQGWCLESPDKLPWWGDQFGDVWPAAAAAQIQTCNVAQSVSSSVK